MNAVRVHKRLESQVIDLPELAPFVGKDVEIVVTEREGQAMPPTPRGRPQFGSGKGVFKMADDFDAPLEDFREYME